MTNHPNRSKRPKWQPMDIAPERVVVLVADKYVGVCAGYMEMIHGKPFWMPHPCERESDRLEPLSWMALPPPPVSSQDGEG